MKFNAFNLLVACLISSTIALSNLGDFSCQQHAAHVDNNEALNIERIGSALALASTECLSYVMSATDNISPIENAKSYYGHLINRLGQLKSATSDGSNPLVFITLKSTIQSLVGLMEAKDELTLKSLCAVIKTIENISHTINDGGKSLKGLDVSENKEVSLTGPNARGNGLSYDVIDLNRGVNITMHHNQVDGVIEMHNQSKQIAEAGKVIPPNDPDQLTLIDDVEMDEDSIKQFAEGLEEKNLEDEAIGIVAGPQNRLLSAAPSSSSNLSSIRVYGTNGEPGWTTCDNLLAADFFGDKGLSLGELKAACTAIMPLDVFKQIVRTPGDAAHLASDVYANLTEAQLDYLFHSRLLVSVEKNQQIDRYVDSSRLGKIGSNDPSICDVMNDPSILEDMRQMTSINANCMKWMDGVSWSSLLSVMGRHVSVEALSQLELNFDPEFSEEMMERLSDVKLTSKQWESIGMADEDFCHELTVEFLENIPDWARNVNRKCLQQNPNLILAIPDDVPIHTQRNMLNNVMKSNDFAEGLLHDDVIEKILSIGLLNHIRELLQEGANCSKLHEHIQVVKADNLKQVIESCNVDLSYLGNATDEQLESLVSKCYLNVGILSIVGSRMPLGQISSTCITKLSPETVAEIPETTLSGLMPKLQYNQLQEIPFSTICENLSNFSKDTVSKLDVTSCRVG